jgi:hypothetical protein
MRNRNPPLRLESTPLRIKQGIYTTIKPTDIEKQGRKSITGDTAVWKSHFAFSTHEIQYTLRKS